jgi:hypothetical protein
MLEFDTDASAETSTGTDDGTNVEPGGDDTGDEPPPAGVPVNAVDILLVMDNSGSMGEEQVRLGPTYATLAGALEELGTDYRIGVTTTDNGNPWCQSTGPEGGRLVATSCRARTGDFIFAGATTLDVTEFACTDNCPSEWEQIELMPTAIADAEGYVARPWLERRGGQTNLPAGLTMAQALRCIAPQGIGGCGFEEHLEAMRKALVRSRTEGEASFGFARAATPLVVIFLTDEEDCSVNKDYETIFLAEGSRLFWSDPSLPAPTSAVCWNAGIQCTGSPDGYDECHSVDLDTSGNDVPEGLATSLAVMRPVSRYVDFLAELEQERQALNSFAGVYVAVIAGTRADGSVSYSGVGDATFLRDFGIDPGCESVSGRAVPPVRLREVAEAFTAGGARNLFSVCDDDYNPAIVEIVAGLQTLLP